MEKTMEYSNGEVTVVWKPQLCIHSEKCTHGLPEVFKPKERPWIQVDKAQTNKIIDTVKTCPSGALSYYMNKVGASKVERENRNDMTKVEVIEKGPLMVYGTLSITHDDGREESKSRVTAFCRCGKSGNQPFCDGTHNK